MRGLHHQYAGLQRLHLCFEKVFGAAACSFRNRRNLAGSESVELQEGQIFEGTISMAGGVGPLRRWIVVAPSGKTHIHSIDDPVDLHCWPINAALAGLENGNLKLVGYEPDHPVLRLQRAKEALGVTDAHMGLNPASLNKMIDLLERAAMTGEAYTPYAAGEILALMPRTLYSEEEVQEIERRVRDVLKAWEERSAG